MDSFVESDNYFILNMGPTRTWRFRGKAGKVKKRRNEKNNKWN
jgi:hypothetical protein